jgi:arylsulfatase A-like enzyme
MSEIRNILFIMCDQLRWDYLSCAGHPHLQTPNIDRLAARGVRFERAYVQSPICGPSRMSFYTGRYVSSHGATWNRIPLRVGELTLGDYLRPLGVQTALVGKTHMRADEEGMARLGIDPDSQIGIRLAECGFDPYERHDGLHPDGPYAPRSAYSDYLRNKGYDGDNPWSTWVNAVDREDGNVGLGWFLKYSDRPARVREEDSETPYITRRAMDFIDQAGEAPWCLHLSYIKPHWPYIVPAPYHDLYGPQHVLPAVRGNSERQTTHPIYRAFMEQRVSKTFSREEVRQRVIPAYMGLIKQIDDQLGVLFDHLEVAGHFAHTMIIFTSDHGDYLGDHWLGEKELFHDASARIPLIVYDPRPQADGARGTGCDALVEAIDLAPTFLEALGGEAQPHRLDGHSLQPLLFGQRPDDWRSFAISEYDYCLTDVRRELGVAIKDSRLYMVATAKWKYVFAEGFREMLFDLEADPNELKDLGEDPALEPVRRELREQLFEWSRAQRQRITVSDEALEARGGKDATEDGIFVGYWDESELEA